MTGDNYYPSACSAFYRFAGHMDKATSSTQNQLLKGLKGIFKKKEDEELTDYELKSLSIEMYHYPINGFKRGLQKVEYKPIQQKVLRLEKTLIFYFKNHFKNYCLNKTNGEETVQNGIFNKIYKNIKTNFTAETRGEGTESHRGKLR